MFRHIKNEKGSHHIWLTIIIIIFSIIGLMFVVKSVKEGRVKENLFDVLDSVIPSQNSARQNNSASRP